ncbi:MAG: hypothetical protein QW177_09015 [Candidatus Nitrosotenuis sp.]
MTNDYLTNPNLRYEVQKWFFLGGRLALASIFLFIGALVLNDGFHDLSYYNNIKQETKSEEMENKSIGSYPGVFWLTTYGIDLSPYASKHIQAGKQVNFHFYVNSNQVMKNFVVYVFHEDLLNVYSTAFNSYLNSGIGISKLKNEWATYAPLTMNDPKKCDVVNEVDKSITRQDGCLFDYNALNAHTFSNSGKYYVLFVTELENGTRAGYLEQATIFSLKDPFEVAVADKMESISTIVEEQQKSNFRAEGLSLIGIGIGLIIGGVAIFDSFVYAKRQYREREKEEEKKTYLTKMMVITLARIREQIRKTNEVLLHAQSVTKSVLSEWNKLNVPAERLETLTIMGSNVVNHEVLDDADLVRGSIIDKPKNDLPGLVIQLGNVESIINNLFADKLNAIREKTLNESLASLDGLRQKHTSDKSQSRNKDQIKLMLDLEESRVRRLFAAS